ncbi:MAG: 4-phosphoerythronate dehydrogenase [Bacteroidales bacterium]
MFDSIDIVADDKIPGLDILLAPFSNVRFIATGDFSRESITNANVLFVRTPVLCNSQLLEGSSVKYIGTASIGFDHIDRAYCAEQGIEWRNAPGCNKGSVLSYILASLSLIAIERSVALTDLCIGIVGVGNIGREIERACRAIGMRVLLNDPPRADKEGGDSFVSLDKIAKECDIITFHTPLSRQGNYPTYHLAGDDFFSKLAKSPIVINAARGGIIDESAMIRAYNRGLVSDMVIDCWEGEPNINRDLLNSVRVATPHIAGFSRDGKFNGTRMSVESMARFFDIEVDTTLLKLPEPTNPWVDCTQLHGDTLCEAVLATYDIDKESIDLKASPESFLRMRNGYPLRRDFCAYNIKNAPSRLVNLFDALGFVVVD